MFTTFTVFTRPFIYIKAIPNHPSHYGCLVILLAIYIPGEHGEHGEQGEQMVGSLTQKGIRRFTVCSPRTFTGEQSSDEWPPLAETGESWWWRRGALPTTFKLLCSERVSGHNLIFTKAKSEWRMRCVHELLRNAMQPPKNETTMDDLAHRALQFEDLAGYVARIKAEAAAKSAAYEEVKRIEHAERVQRIRRTMPLETLIQQWFNAQPDAMKWRRYSLAELIALFPGRFADRPAVWHFGIALQTLGWTHKRDWSNAGRNRRYWLPPGYTEPDRRVGWQPPVPEGTTVIGAR